KVGVDLALGGAITELFAAGRGHNLLDSREWGRQLQATYFGGPAPYSINAKRPAERWLSAGWNPAQVGDSFRHPSPVVEHENDGKTIRVKVRPLQWALDNEPAECTIETRLRLDGPVLHV